MKTRYWDSLADSWEPGGQDSLWREHSDAVNRVFVERLAPPGGTDLILKTDSFDEAVCDGLKEILDAPDAWAWPTGGPNWTAGGAQMVPTDDGKKYTPSIVEFLRPCPLHAEHYDGTDWEVELVLAENTDDPNSLTIDPCVLINIETGGCFGSFFSDAPGDVQDLPRAAVIGEYILNYYLVEIVAVESDGKLISTWGEIKGF